MGPLQNSEIGRVFDGGSRGEGGLDRPGALERGRWNHAEREAGSGERADERHHERTEARLARLLDKLADAGLPNQLTLAAGASLPGGVQGGDGDGDGEAAGLTGADPDSQIAGLSQLAASFGGPGIALALASRTHAGRAALEGAGKSVSDLARGDVGGALKDAGQGLLGTIGGVAKDIGGLFGL